MKTFISGLLALVMAVSVLAPATASAASSWNGVYNSNGKSLNSWKQENRYQYTSYSSQQQILQAYIRQLEQLLAQLRAQQQWDNDWDDDWNSGSSDVTVTTRSVDNVEDDMATLRGRIDFGNSDDAVVYFQWGTQSNRLNEETPNIVLEDNDDEDFSARIDDLDENRTYYFRAVAEDEDGRLDYGSILSFRSDDDQNDDDDDWDDDDNDEDQPDVETLGTTNVRTTSAELRGEVDMNDFEDGYVFLVYGEDEDMVDEIADEYDEYADIDTDGDNLQKTGVYSGLDDYRTFWTTVSNLDEDTEVFYAYCVEYEDEDNDETITCGDTESFTTDED